MNNTPKKLILIDGNAIIHRAYHALPPLTTKSGELVNAVYGFSSTLLSVIEQFKPDYVVASFDLAGPTFRHQQFTEYKANRVKGDDELYAQIPRVKEVVKAFNIPIYEKAGFEADDVIGTISRQAFEFTDPIETIIVTGDMDTLQLVNEKTKVFTMKRGLSDSVIYDDAKVFERYGLVPKKLIDFKGLRGDPSDNIPGVKGIGEKTAVTLLQKYQTLEGVYQNIEEIKGAVKEKLIRDKAQAILSKELATIDLNTPVQIDFEKSKLADFDREKIVKLFSELNFFSLIKRLPRTSSEIANGKTENENQGVSDFKYEIADEKNIDLLLEELSKASELAISLEEKDGEIKGIGISKKTGRGVLFPAEKKYLEKLSSILDNPEIKKIGYDLKSIYKILKKNNLNLENISSDIMLSAYTLDPGTKITLESLIFSELGEEITFEQKKGQLSLVPSEDDGLLLSKKVCQKADYAFKLNSILQKKILEISSQQKNQGNTVGTLENVFTEIEMPLVKVLADMELAGIKIDPLIFKGISEKITARIKNLEKSIHEISGSDFNINSPSQLAEILFVKLGISTENIKKNKTGYSTAAAELAKLRGEGKIISKIEEYRELFKLKTTYLDALPLLIDADCRIHTTFKQAVAATGRLSSTDPNLQNIPIKTELGQLLRTAFVAKDGYLLISGDYSQIDLRVVAHVSKDKKMIEAFHRGDDIHKITAAEVNKVTLSQVTDTMRRNAKELNFGIIYGMGSFGFSQSAGISRQDAQDFINTYMDKFSGVAKYMKNTKEFARKNGFVETLVGRRRNIAEINSSNFQVVSGAERMAINMPIQGLAADIVKIAMIKVSQEFENNPEVKMILQIHDEIILEVKEGVAKEVALRVKELMENAYKLSVPLIADIKVGENWGEI